MSAVQPLPVSSPGATWYGQRVTSIDIFRGLTMMVMIFVNDLSSVQGLPWWTYHAHEEQDLMTYVDMVFPFFLFIVGLSIPLAIARRLEKNSSHLLLWLHILLRSAGLIILGLILANAEKADPPRIHMPMAVWALLALFGAILIWLVPSRNRKYVPMFRALRIVGIILLFSMFAIFRRTTRGGASAGIDNSYPEILGIIGYTYLAVSILYVPTRRWRWAPLGWFVALSAYCALMTAHIIHMPWALPPYLWPFGGGDSPSIAMAGVVTSTLLLRTDGAGTIRSRMLIAVGFALAVFGAAWLLIPLGISKDRGTPTWCLTSVGASVLTFLLLYWICDLKGKTSWAFLVKPAGENTLLTYLLPDIYYYFTLLVGFTYFAHHLNSGWEGVASATIFTLVILAVSGLLTRLHVRLQL